MVAAFDANDAVAEGDDTWAAGGNFKGDSVANNAERQRCDSGTLMPADSGSSFWAGSPMV